MNGYCTGSKGHRGVSVPLRGKDSHEPQYVSFLVVASAAVSVPLRGKDSHERTPPGGMASDPLRSFRPLAGKR